jgi:hypothetical protein
MGVPLLERSRELGEVGDRRQRRAGIATDGFADDGRAQK